MRPLTDEEQRLIRIHCADVARYSVSDKTPTYRAGVLQRLARVLPEGVTLQNAENSHLRTWQANLGVSRSTEAGYSAHVRQFYAWLVEREYRADNPATITSLRSPKVPKRLPRPIPEEDFQTALACARDEAYVWLLLAGFLGFRCMEIAGMRQENITRVGDRVFVSGIGKWGKPFKMQVPKHVEPHLMRYVTGRPGPVWFTGTGGRATTAQQVSQQMSAFFRSIGMPYTLHRGRHSFGTNLYQQTKDILLTKEAMRHDSTESTLLYVQTSGAMGAAAMDRLAEKKLQRAARRPRPPRDQDRVAS